MLARNHGLSGVAAWAVLAPWVGGTVDPATFGVGALIAAGAALAPDLDHPGSTASRTFGPAGEALARAVASGTGGHRGATHTPVFAAGVGLVVATVASLGPAATTAVAGLFAVFGGRWARSFLPPLFGWVVAGLAVWLVHVAAVDVAWLPWTVGVGWVAHVAGDALTRSGVPLGWPLTWRRCGVPLLTTGSGVEGAVTVVLVGLSVWVSHGHFVGAG